MAKSDLDVFVMSAGFKEEYHWINENPFFNAIYKKDFNEIREKNIINLDEFGIYIYHYKPRWNPITEIPCLIFFVSRMSSRFRQDARGRKITNTVVWCAKDENEQTIRQLLLLALQNKLRDIVDECITSKNDGYEANIDRLKTIFQDHSINNYNFGDNVQTQDALAPKVAWTKPLKHGSENFEGSLIESLIKDIMNYKLNLESSGFILLINEYTSLDVMERIKPWGVFLLILYQIKKTGF